MIVSGHLNSFRPRPRAKPSLSTSQDRNVSPEGHLRAHGYSSTTHGIPESFAPPRGPAAKNQLVKLAVSKVPPNRGSTNKKKRRKHRGVTKVPTRIRTTVRRACRLLSSFPESAEPRGPEVVRERVGVCCVTLSVYSYQVVLFLGVSVGKAGRSRSLSPQSAWTRRSRPA